MYAELPDGGDTVGCYLECVNPPCDRVSVGIGIKGATRPWFSKWIYYPDSDNTTQGVQTCYNLTTMLAHAVPSGSGRLRMVATILPRPKDTEDWYNFSFSQHQEVRFVVTNGRWDVPSTEATG